MKTQILKWLFIFVSISLMAGACDKVTIKQDLPTTPDASYGGAAK